MLDGFFVGKDFDTRTKKQKLETRIRNSVINLIIDRNQSYLYTARQQNTNVFIRKGDGLIEEFYNENRKYISIPDSFEDKFENMTDIESETYCDELMKLVLTTNDVLRDGELVSDFQASKAVTHYKFDGSHIDSKVVSEPIYQYREQSKDKTQEEQEAIEDSENCIGNITQRGMSDNSSESNYDTNVSISGDDQDLEYEFEDTQLNPDCKLPKEVEKTEFYNSSYSQIKPHREVKLKALANQIVKSFNGIISKQNTIVPSKKINIKKIITDTTDKIYTNKKGTNGKHLKVNLIIDMSGSMSGTPVKNAIEMIYIFNELALQNKVSGSVIWSEQHSRCKVKFPMPREFVRNMSNTGGSEGLGRNLQHYKKELKESDVNICMTDGQLCDDAIMKSMYEKENIKIIGVYVNQKAKDLTQYTNSLNRWFSHSVVRRTTEELCEKLITFGLRKKNNR